MFSSRLRWDLPTNPLALLAAEKRAAGMDILDLTESNPTRAGFAYPRGLLESLADPRGLVYEPAPCGLQEAREAIARHYAARGIRIDPGQVLITASTSEAYGYLFKLLADPGDEILVPRPSYPLFEHLAALESLGVRHYSLRYEGRWRVDFESLRESITKRTRAIVVVNPNNPTGSFVKRHELDELAGFGLPIISDEVFADYSLSADPQRVSTLAGTASAPVFCLSGLSKIAGLPQVKLGWMIVPQGPFRERLEWIADTYLSVSTPVQLAASKLLAASGEIQAQIRSRLLENHRLAKERAAASAIELLDVEGGWYATLRVPRTRSEEQWALELLRDDGVLVQPGYFFDFESEAYLVVSLLTPPGSFEEGLKRLFARAG